MHASAMADPRRDTAFWADWNAFEVHPSCCVVLCCAVLCCAVLCCAVLCCAVLCFAKPWQISEETPASELTGMLLRYTHPAAYAALRCAVLCCAVLCCAAPPYARNHSGLYTHICICVCLYLSVCGSVWLCVCTVVCLLCAWTVAAGLGCLPPYHSCLLFFQDAQAVYLCAASLSQQS